MVFAAVAPDVTSLYAGLAGLLAIFLSMRTIQQRRKMIFTKNGDEQLLDAHVRSFANFTEYAPLGLLMLALVECRGKTPGWLLHALGATLIASRAVHAYSGSIPVQQLLSSMSAYGYARQYGMVLTLGATLPTALLLLRFPSWGALAVWAVVIIGGPIALQRPK